MIYAINAAIKIAFPSTAEECAVLAAQFENISCTGVILNCIAAADGFLLLIETPSKKEAKNVHLYFSGHYQKYSTTIQVCCDAYCRFAFMGVGGPGVTKDWTVVQESGLFEKVKQVPQGYICIVDCAYEPTEHFVLIFGGDLALQKDNDNFNFYASQLCIWIKMAFGMMTRKRGVLQHPLKNSLSLMKHIICCITRLHNLYQRLKETLRPADLKTDKLLFTQLDLRADRLRKDERSWGGPTQDIDRPASVSVGPIICRCARQFTTDPEG